MGGWVCFAFVEEAAGGAFLGVGKDFGETGEGDSGGGEGEGSGAGVVMWEMICAESAWWASMRRR